MRLEVAISPLRQISLKRELLPYLFQAVLDMALALGLFAYVAFPAVAAASVPLQKAPKILPTASARYSDTDVHVAHSKFQADYWRYQSSYWRAQIPYISSYTKDQAKLSAIRVRIYQNQMLDSRILLAVVIVIVLTGLVLAALQMLKGTFYAVRVPKRPARELSSTQQRVNQDAASAEPKSKADEQGAKTRESAPKADDSAGPSTIRAGLQGLEIQSSSIGLLILTVSLAFFYLYLKQVYPIVPWGH